MAEDAYANPGTPYTPAGRDAVLTHSGSIVLLGLGASPEGDRPFADRLDLTTGTATRLFRSSGDQFEQVVAVVSGDWQPAPHAPRVEDITAELCAPRAHAGNREQATGNRGTGTVGTRVALTSFG